MSRKVLTHPHAPALTAWLTAAMFAVLALPARAVAADGEKTPLNLDTAERAVGGDSPGPGGGAIVRTIVGLAVVIAVIYGLTWVLKQLKSSREGHATGAGLETLATLPLGPNRSLHLVRAGTEVVLIGAAEQGVVPVRTYSEEEARALGLLVDDDDSGDGGFGPPSGRPAITERQSGLRGWLDDLRARTVIK